MSKRVREDEDEEAPAVVEAPAPEASTASSDPKSEKQERQARDARMALAALPDQEMYEKSYMHRDVVTHLVVTATDFIVTASRDGQLKFWKKQQTGVDFVKHFRAHLAPIVGLSVTFDGTLLATSAADKGLKIFDVQSFDMIHWIKLDYTPGPCEWIGGSSSSRALLACADANEPLIRLYDGGSGDTAPVHELRIHASPVLQIKRNVTCGSVISVDAKGVIEYWRNDGGDGLPAGLGFRHKTETHLYELAKCKARPTSLSVSPDGAHFAVTSSDAKVRPPTSLRPPNPDPQPSPSPTSAPALSPTSAPTLSSTLSSTLASTPAPTPAPALSALKVRLFRYATGKTRRTYDEGLDALHELQKGGDEAYRLEAFDFGRRMAVEREYRANQEAAPSSVCFDETGKLMLFASLVGIKVPHAHRSRAARTPHARRMCAACALHALWAAWAPHAHSMYTARTLRYTGGCDRVVQARAAARQGGEH